MSLIYESLQLLSYRLKRCYKRSTPQPAKKISLNDSNIFQFHSPDPSTNSFDETIPPLPPPMPPLSDPKPAKSNTQIKKRLRIADFVLNQPSSPGTVSHNPTVQLPLSPSPVIPSVQLPMIEQFSTTVTTGGFITSTPLQECVFFPSFISPDKVVPSPISITQEREPPGQPSKSAHYCKSAPPTGHPKSAPTAKSANSKAVNPPNNCEFK